MPAVKTHTPELRAALINEGGRLLHAEGPAAVSLRRVASATGTSTTAVYALFGDKAGLIEEMYIEGFRRLTEAVTIAPATTEPVQDLLAMACAYRRAAMRSPHLYNLMFAHPVPEFRPSSRSLAVAGRALQPLVVAVMRCIESGEFRPGSDAQDVAYHLWAVAHGLVMLEIHRTLPLKRSEYTRRYSFAVSASVASYLDNPPRARGRSRSRRSPAETR